MVPPPSPPPPPCPLLPAGLADRSCPRERRHCDWAPPDTSPPQPEEYPRLKVALYLDDLTCGGSLGFLPGTHRPEYREAVKPLLRRAPQGGEESYQAIHGTPYWSDEANGAGLEPAAIPGAVDTRTRPVDLLFFSTLIFHSSFGAAVGDTAQGKRTFQLVYGPTQAELAAPHVGEGKGMLARIGGEFGDERLRRGERWLKELRRKSAL